MQNFNSSSSTENIFLKEVSEESPECFEDNKESSLKVIRKAYNPFSSNPEQLTTDVENLVEILHNLTVKEAFEILYNKPSKTPLDRLVLAACREDVLECVDLITQLAPRHKEIINLITTLEQEKDKLYYPDPKKQFPFHLIKRCMDNIDCNRERLIELSNKYTTDEGLLPSYRILFNYEEEIANLDNIFHYHSVTYIPQLNLDIENPYEIFGYEEPPKLYRKESIIYPIYQNLKKGNIKERELNTLICRIVETACWQDEEIWKSLIRFSLSANNDYTSTLLLKELGNRLFREFCKQEPSSKEAIKTFIYSISASMRMPAAKRLYVRSFLNNITNENITEKNAIDADSLEGVLKVFKLQGFEGLQALKENSKIEGSNRASKIVELKLTQYGKIWIPYAVNASILAGAYLKYAKTLNAKVATSLEILIFGSFASVAYANFKFLSEYKSTLIEALLPIALGTVALIKYDTIKEFLQNNIPQQLDLRVLFFGMSIFKVLPTIFKKGLGPSMFSGQETAVECLFNEIQSSESFISGGKIANLGITLLELYFVYNTNFKSDVPYLNYACKIVVSTAMASNIYLTFQELWNNRTRESLLNSEHNI